jgi:hypothetical protein
MVRSGSPGFADAVDARNSKPTRTAATAARSAVARHPIVISAHDKSTVSAAGNEKIADDPSYASDGKPEQRFADDAALGASVLARAMSHSHQLEKSTLLGMGSVWRSESGRVHPLH